MNSEPAIAQPEELKAEIRSFWNRQSCDTQVAKSEKFSKQYFEEIEQFRYFDQPFIHSFAQFSRYHGKKVLEVGFGAGTDFIQWLRAGARASGIDLTDEALANVRRRISVYELPPPESLQVGDAENLPFETNTFDLGYSFGVLFLAPDNRKALGELARVIRPGGEMKIMFYNRRSIYALNLWVKHALLKGRPWKSVSWALWHFLESLGTRAHTRKEMLDLLSGLRLENIHIHTEVTAADYLSASAFRPLNWLYRVALRLGGYTYGWHPGQYVDRIDAPTQKQTAQMYQRDPKKPLITGNRFGFFHCISARKAL